MKQTPLSTASNKESSSNNDHFMNKRISERSLPQSTLDRYMFIKGVDELNDRKNTSHKQKTIVDDHIKQSESSNILQQQNQKETYKNQNRSDSDLMSCNSQESVNKQDVSTAEKQLVVTTSTESFFESDIYSSRSNDNSIGGISKNKINSTESLSIECKYEQTVVQKVQPLDFEHNQQPLAKSDNCKTPTNIVNSSVNENIAKKESLYSDYKGENGERMRRSCREKTSKYSLTHAGVAVADIIKEQKLEKLEEGPLQIQNQENSKIHQTTNTTCLAYSSETTVNVIQPEAKTHKRATARSANECLEVFKNMLAADWDLKDIASLRYSPYQEITPSVFWFYVNSLYFPFRALQISQKPFEEFARPINQNLIPLSFQELTAQQVNDEQTLNEDQQQLQKLTIVKSLANDEKITQFKKIFIEFQEKLQQKSQEIEEVKLDLIKRETQQDEEMEDQKMEIEDDQNLNKIQSMIDLLTKETELLSENNKKEVESQFQKMKVIYDNALDNESQSTQEDSFPYRADKMLEYGQSFLSHVDPTFAKDINSNLNWYLENYNEILLNLNYPSRQEKDFLKFIEQEQSHKNDQNYKKILKQVEESSKRGTLATVAIEDSRYQNLSANKRELVHQEDAQCAICNSGDYEDEDLIVFCGNCNIPVHQSCYGIEQLPEGDWICYNCDIFGFKRGLLVQCSICPKKGGVMKPTNIFAQKHNQEKVNNSNTAATSIMKTSHHKKGSIAYKLQQQIYSTEAATAAAISDETQKALNNEKEDKTLSLTAILKREFDYQVEIRKKLKEETQQNNMQNGSADEEEQVQLHFNFEEKEKQLPNDYNFFLQRNEPRLESSFTAKTETFYEWIHISCASWIPGPIITPKTPVRLNKLDEKRFQLQCIICLKKEGACMQCQASRCTISFHVECARRNNYCMEIDRKERDKQYKMFCERHRPLKIVKEMEEKDRQNIDEIQRFCKIIEKSNEIDQKAQLKPQKPEKEYPVHVAKNQICKASKKVKIMNKDKKWREKDKKQLFEKVKDKYLLFRKMRINVIQVNPVVKVKKLQPRKRSKKRQSKKLQHKGSNRGNLRSKADSLVEENNNDNDDVLEEPPRLEDNQHSQNNETCEMIDVGEENKQSQETLTTNQHNNQADTDKAVIEGIHYKFNFPMFPLEMDWRITLSRNDFPWHEIKFNYYSADECYEKYLSVVKDSHTFLKKVLGLKEKYKKLMHNQIQQQSLIQQQNPASAASDDINNIEATIDTTVYCSCKGLVPSDYYVKCDGDDECPNRAWLHPECSIDLKDKSKEYLDNMEEWYCQDCLTRICQENAEDEQEKKEEEDEEDMLVEDIDLSQVDSDINQNQDPNNSNKNQNECSAEAGEELKSIECGLIIPNDSQISINTDEIIS